MGRRRSTRSYKLPNNRGTAYVAFGYYNMDNVLYLAPALEVMHSTGGRGLTENFLGLDASEDGTGHMYTLASRREDEHHRPDRRARVRHGDVGALAAGRRDGPAARTAIAASTSSGASSRATIVLPQAARVGALRPRHPRRVRLARTASACCRRGSRSRSTTWGEMFFQYSHYWYGDKVQLRPGQVPLETDARQRRRSSCRRRSSGSCYGWSRATISVDPRQR